MLTKTEAQQIAEKFLLAIYYDSKIKFNNTLLEEDIQKYQFQGEITMQSRGSLTRFTANKGANKYDFKIEIDAQQGQVIGYELI